MLAPSSSVNPGLTGLPRTAQGVFANRPAAELVELALARDEGGLTDRGALVTRTGKHTGRAPQDRSIVADPAYSAQIDWGPINRPMAPDSFDRLYHRVLAYLQGRELFVTDARACADPRYQLPVRVVGDRAWHALFAACLLRDPGAPFDPATGLTVLCASGLHAEPSIDGTRTETFIVLHLARRLVLIGGTGYAGEIKKSVFSHLNYHLPQLEVFPMHCAANAAGEGDAALFFGLSGTGKTTLSADPDRRLIGDDEHGWSDDGVFNIEGGCYAKCIRLSQWGEPQIWDALRFGSVLENVVVDPETRVPDFDADRYTENTRAAYPLSSVAGAEPTSRGAHPQTVLFLTCDAFGVLPPVARLTLDSALYHFLSGYTAKVAGTEDGVREPEATFSACFAAPFLPLRPARYAELLAEKLRRHGSTVWLVNTGWTGGPPGQGRRISLSHTRAIVNAVLSGALASVPVRLGPVFNLPVPERCPGVPDVLLRPRETWADGAAYDGRARQLAALFRANFARHAADVPETVREAGPRE